MSDMIKIKRKNYIEERAKERKNNDKNEIVNQIKSSGVFLNDRYENTWKLRNERNNINLTEDNFQIRQIIRRYHTNQDEIKGFNSKYLIQLTDLLGKKDKNFPKKRMQLYNKRINNKNILFHNNEKNIKEAYKTISTMSPNSETNNSPKKYESPNKFIFQSSRPKGSRTLNCDFNLNLNNKNSTYSLYSKTMSAFYSPIKTKSSKFKYNLSKSGNKIDNLKYKKRNRIAKKVISSYFGNNDEDSTGNLINGKDQFLLSGDKDRYHKYLQKKYKFFLTPDINNMIYLYEKSERNKMFENSPNYKFLEKKEIYTSRNEFFNKIKRDKKNYI